MQEIIIKRSRLSPLLIVLGCLGFVAIGIWMLYDDPRNIVISWITIIFFGLGGAAHAMHTIVLIMRGQYDILINSQGIYDHSTLISRPVLWSEIASIDLLGQQTTARRGATDALLIQITLRDEYENISSPPGLLRRIVVAANRAAGYRGLFMSTKGIKMSPEQLLEILQQYHQRATNRGKPVTENSGK